MRGRSTARSGRLPIEGANALKFDGNDRVDFASSIPLLEDVTIKNFTVSASVVASVATLTKLGRIVSKCNATANGCTDGLELLVEDRADGGTPGLALRVPTVNTLSDKIQDPAPFPLDVIVRVAGIYDATTTPTGSVYRDGNKVAASGTAPCPTAKCARWPARLAPSPPLCESRTETVKGYKRGGHTV